MTIAEKIQYAADKKVVNFLKRVYFTNAITKMPWFLQNWLKAIR
jgi:hypothetical protein